MRRTNYIIRSLALAAAAALTGVCVCGCKAENDSENTSGYYVKTEYSYSIDELAGTISDALAEYDNHTDYDAAIEQDDIDSAVRRIKHFYPEYFWLNGYTTSSTSKRTSLSFMTLNDYSKDELRTMHDELIKAADDVIAQVPQTGTDFEKALFVHDYIVNNTRYATEKRGLDYNGLWGNAYGCLVEGSAVCQGYAEAYSLIMQRLGIECGVCSGQSDRGSHAWNYIKVDGEYYWVDVTWDDPEAESEEDGDKLRHNYFMMNDELMLRTRTIGDGQYYVPSCTSMKYNYFVMTNAYLSGYDLDEIGRILADNKEYGVAEMMFADAESFSAARNGLFDEQQIWELSDYAELGYTLNYSYDETMCVLQISY